ncbi:forkhead box protein B2-like [Anneissia japonica]|uniref:forkhead box protein B2-like n=1 Tax=Anneissia japonica TaxID=1529436 RepID=UPI001425A8A6|nr:forkhead box protein B2-like [Anneissia japonica]
MALSKTSLSSGTLTNINEQDSFGLTVPLSPPSSETGNDGSSPNASPVKETKPIFSYIALIAKAILNSSESRLLLSDIYQYIMDNYPYYRNNDRSWRNSIRHNLSLNECFIKSGRSNDGRGHFWAIHPANVEDFMRGDYRRRRARLRVRATITAKSYETPYYPYSTPNCVYGGTGSYVTMSRSVSSNRVPYTTSPYMAPNSLSPYDMMPYNTTVSSVDSVMSMPTPSLFTPSSSSLTGSSSNTVCSTMTSQHSQQASEMETSMHVASITPPSSPENQANAYKTYFNRVATAFNSTDSMIATTLNNNSHQMFSLGAPYPTYTV